MNKSLYEPPRRSTLYEPLMWLYEDTVEYCEINNLGHWKDKHVLREARKALVENGYVPSGYY
jgi:hypothetical protein